MTAFESFTDEERAVFDENFADAGFGMMRVTIDGVPRAAVVRVTDEDTDNVFIQPVAIIVTSDMFDSIDPGEGVEAVPQFSSEDTG